MKRGGQSNEPPSPNGQQLVLSVAAITLGAATTSGATAFGLGANRYQFWRIRSVGGGGFGAFHGNILGGMHGGFGAYRGFPVTSDM
jgi:hypothetical protein